MQVLTGDLPRCEAGTRPRPPPPSRREFMHPAARNQRSNLARLSKDTTRETNFGHFSSYLERSNSPDGLAGRDGMIKNLSGGILRNS